MHKLHKTRVKVIVTHERPNDLLALLETYTQVYERLGEGLSRPAGGTIIDSSKEPAGAQIRRLADELELEYEHSPGKRFTDKVNQSIINGRLSAIAWEKDTYIDFCTDQDPTFYSANDSKQDKDKSSSGIENCPTLGWIRIAPNQNEQRLNTSKPQILLRSQGSCTSIRALGSGREAINTARVRCMIPNPNQYWGSIRSDIFLIRAELASSLEENLSDDLHKIIECFFNIFHSFATQSSVLDSLRLRACDDRASLRATRSDMSSARASFSSIYTHLREHQKDCYLRCLTALRDAIAKLASADASVLPISQILDNSGISHELPSLDILDKLIQLTVISYAKAIEYDLHMDLYLLAHHSDAYKQFGWPVERILPGGGHPGIYAFWRNNPLLITPQTEADALSLAAPNLILANKSRLKILQSIPDQYWVQTQSWSQEDSQQ